MATSPSAGTAAHHRPRPSSRAGPDSVTADQPTITHANMPADAAHHELRRIKKPIGCFGTELESGGSPQREGELERAGRRERRAGRRQATRRGQHDERHQRGDQVAQVASSRWVTTSAALGSIVLGRCSHRGIDAERLRDQRGGTSAPRFFLPSACSVHRPAGVAMIAVRASEREPVAR